MKDRLVILLETLSLNDVAQVYDALNKQENKELDLSHFEIKHLISLLTLYAPFTENQTVLLNEAAIALSSKLRGEFIRTADEFDPEFAFESLLRHIMISMDSAANTD